MPKLTSFFLSSSLTITIIYKTGSYLTSKITTILCRHPSRPSKNYEYIHNSKFLSHQNSTRQSIVYLYISIHPSESSIAVLHVETIQQQQTVIVISRDDQVFTTRSCFLCFTYIRQYQPSKYSTYFYYYYYWYYTKTYQHTSTTARPKMTFQHETNISFRYANSENKIILL